MAQKMKLQTFVLSILLVWFFTQCTRSGKPRGYYCVINEYYKPAYIFYYNNSLHGSPFFLHNKRDSIMNVFREKKDVFAFYDGNTNIDTLLFTVTYGCQSTYHFTFTPSLCKFYVYNPIQLVGTYEFTPTKTEQELISFAVSQLDFGDSIPDFNSFKKQPDNVIIEDAFFSLLVKSDRINIDIFAHLYADEIPDEVFFLSDALDALVHDYCNIAYRIIEDLDDNVMELFDRKILEKYIPSIPCCGDFPYHEIKDYVE